MMICGLLHPVAVFFITPGPHDRNEEKPYEQGPEDDGEQASHVATILLPERAVETPQVIVPTNSYSCRDFQQKSDQHGLLFAE